MKFAVAPVHTSSLPYQFNIVEGGEFPANSRYGSIERSKFCLLGIVGEEKKNGGQGNGHEDSGDEGKGGEGGGGEGGGGGGGGGEKSNDKENPDSDNVIAPEVCTESDQSTHSTIMMSP